jgi:hypothetical protein
MQKTLTEVIHETFKNSDFLEKLLSGVDKALASKGWTMTAEDRQKLDELLENQQVSDPATVLRAFNSAVKGNAPWQPPPWSKYTPDR